MRTWFAGALATFALFACAPPAEQPAAPTEAPASSVKLEILDIETGARRVVLEQAEIGAPNFSRDGAALYFNAAGLLYRVPAAGGAPTQLDTGAIDIVTHDHGPSPDGAQLAFSAYDRPDPETRIAHIHLIPIAGGAPRQLTNAQGPSYFHAWSPDGARIAFTGRRAEDNYDIYDIDVATGAERRLTNAPGTDDAADYALDGTIYFNSARSGAMRIWKMNADGSNQTQVTNDDAYQDWFPHPSPDGRWLIWLSYPAHVEGLASSTPVVLRLMPLDGSAPPRVVAEFVGGQGSINGPPWSPDSRSVAFVSY